MSRYEIRTNPAGHFEVVDHQNNVTVSPKCHLDMAQFNAYLTSNNMHEQSQDFLAEVCVGGTPISDMINRFQRTNQNAPVCA